MNTKSSIFIQKLFCSSSIILKSHSWVFFYIYVAEWRLFSNACHALLNRYHIVLAATQYLFLLLNYKLIKQYHMQRINRRRWRLSGFQTFFMFSKGIFFTFASQPYHYHYHYFHYNGGFVYEYKLYDCHFRKILVSSTEDVKELIIYIMISWFAIQTLTHSSGRLILK